MNDRFSLNQEEAWYTLSIELQSPIDMVLLQVCRDICIYSEIISLVCVCVCSQSDVPVDLQEVDKTSAVVSHSPPDPEVRGQQLVVIT